jgi:hypothetical protein
MNIHLRIEHPLQGGLHHPPHQLVEVFDRPSLARHLVGQLFHSGL